MAEQQTKRHFEDRPFLPHDRRVIGAWLAVRDGAAKSSLAPTAALERDAPSGPVTMVGLAAIFLTVAILILSLT